MKIKINPGTLSEGRQGHPLHKWVCGLYGGAVYRKIRRRGWGRVTYGQVGDSWSRVVIWIRTHTCSFSLNPCIVMTPNVMNFGKIVYTLHTHTHTHTHTQSNSEICPTESWAQLIKKLYSTAEVLKLEHPLASPRKLVKACWDCWALVLEMLIS